MKIDRIGLPVVSILPYLGYDYRHNVWYVAWLTWQFAIAI